MTDLPFNLSDGQELPASVLNQMLTARTGDIKPIDDTTREYTDEAGALGSATYRYTEAHIDNIKIDGNTISATNPGGYINLDGIVSGYDGGQLKISNFIGNIGVEQSFSKGSNQSGAVVIQATKDIVVYLLKYYSSNSSNDTSNSSTFRFYSDGNSNPTTQLYESLNSLYPKVSYTNWLGVSFFVKKGNYFRIDIVNSTSISGTVYYRIQEIST